MEFSSTADILVMVLCDVFLQQTDAERTPAQCLADDVRNSLSNPFSQVVAVAVKKLHVHLLSSHLGYSRKNELNNSQIYC